MPFYDCECQDCGSVHEQRHRMADPHGPCPKCRSTSVITIFTQPVRVNPPLDRNWESLNGGRGQYFSQLEESKTCTRSAENFFRSRNDAIEACKRRGYDIISK